MLKKDLKEKESNFFKLREFYRMRENKLATEEAILLNEKRGYAKLISSLIKQHIKIATKDLEKTEDRLKKIKEKNQKAAQQIKDYEKKLKDLKKEQERIKKEIKNKRDYFKNVETEFRAKDLEFSNIDKSLNERLDHIAQREKSLLELKEHVLQKESEVRKRDHELELMEFDTKRHEREIDKLKFSINNNELILTIREKQLKKRIESYELIKEDVSRNIRREKRAINRLERKLRSKDISLKKRLSKVGDEENEVDQYHKGLFDLAHSLSEGQELQLKEIKVSYPEAEVGNPTVLDILRLLNKAKDFLKNDQKERARDVYLEIQRRFEELDDSDRTELYDEILKVFKTKSDVRMNAPSTPSMDQLLQEFEESIASNNMSQAQVAYNEIQDMYAAMSQDERSKYYQRVMDLYNQISNKV